MAHPEPDAAGRAICATVAWMLRGIPADLCLSRNCCIAATVMGPSGGPWGAVDARPRHSARRKEFLPDLLLE